MTSANLTEYRRRAARFYEAAHGGARECPFCKRPIEFTDEELMGIPAGYPLECECVNRLYASGLDEQRQQERVSAYDAHFRESLIPERYKHAATRLTVASAYIYGDVGVGKTSEGCGILLKAIKAGMSAMFVTTSMIQDASFEERRSLLDRMESVDVLMFDDFGKAETSEWADSIAFRAIDVRYGTGKTTVFTSNHSMSELAALIASRSDAAMGKAIVSRIKEMCGDGIRMTGENRRIA